MGNIWFTADTHYNHYKIIDYCERPYTHIQDMNDALVRALNSRVAPNDQLWHLGDWSIGGIDAVKEFRHRINCKNVFIVTGNHDTHFKKEEIKDLFSGVWKNFHERKFNKQRITLCHYRLDVWNKSHHGAWHLHGHSHGSLCDRNDRRSLDVGIDCWDFSPVRIDEIDRAMEAKQWTPIDHHGARASEDFDQECKRMLRLNKENYMRFLDGHKDKD